MSDVYEYDGYTLPEPRGKEIPNSQVLLAQKLEEIKEMAKRHREEAEKRESMVNH